MTHTLPLEGKHRNGMKRYYQPSPLLPLSLCVYVILSTIELRQMLFGKGRSGEDSSPAHDHQSTWWLRWVPVYMGGCRAPNIGSGLLWRIALVTSHTSLYKQKKVMSIVNLLRERGHPDCRIPVPSHPPRRYLFVMIRPPSRTFLFVLPWTAPPKGRNCD